MLGSVTLDLDPFDRGCSTIGRLVLTTGCRYLCLMTSFKDHSTRSVFRSVRGLHCTWLVPYMRAFSNGVDVSDSKEWIHLKRGVDHGGCGQIDLRGHRIMLCGEVGRLVESQEGLETKVVSRADLTFQLRSSPSRRLKHQ
ncbi:hypothetical protein M9H77_03092 [Catharanthus roseus]|uniref:Uncharacterized protein n=1 Tax=Catharanthus roseus TaxID=4058 RepID=A0ACC0CAF1_CATRO|nr:hypothetical protein M9H77_03092 [Catharanthus roseus]